MQGEEASSEEEEATKEELLEDAESVLREIDADKEQEHRGVFQCMCGAGVRRSGRWRTCRRSGRSCDRV